MPQTGVEPALTNVNSDLNAVRLPIPPLKKLKKIYFMKPLRLENLIRIRVITVRFC